MDPRDRFPLALQLTQQRHLTQEVALGGACDRHVYVIKGLTTTRAVEGSSLAPFKKTPQLPRGFVPPRKLVEGAVSAGVGEKRTSRAEEGARYGDLGVECP